MGGWESWSDRDQWRRDAPSGGKGGAKGSGKGYGPPQTREPSFGGLSGALAQVRRAVQEQQELAHMANFFGIAPGLPSQPAMPAQLGAWGGAAGAARGRGMAVAAADPVLATDVPPAGIPTRGTDLDRAAGPRPGPRRQPLAAPRAPPHG